jgi:hypothetical protein
VGGVCLPGERDAGGGSGRIPETAWRTTSDDDAVGRPLDYRLDCDGIVVGLVVLALNGPHAALTYLTAYLLEKTLSIDNVFVFVVIFSQLQIPPLEQRRVLYWGVLGALIMRALMIAGGIYLLERFHWVVYLFAALVILAALRMMFGKKKEEELITAFCAVCDSWWGASSRSNYGVATECEQSAEAETRSRRPFGQAGFLCLNPDEARYGSKGRRRRTSDLAESGWQ